MKRSTKFLLIFLFLLPSLLKAQKEANIWYFGQKAGITFNTNPPSAIKDSKMLTSEGTAVMADARGNLLFYTDGITVWDKTHSMMANGNDLTGNISTTQSAVIFKNNYEEGTYYVVTCDAIGGKGQGVAYSVVDMRLNNKNGAVTVKNVRLVNGSTEKLTAVSHPNKKDVWLATVIYNTDSICIFKTTSTGLVLNSAYRTGKTYSAYCAGQAKFSTDGRYFALANTGDATALLFDFDTTAGVLSNPRELSSLDDGPYGLEFARSAKYLYISELYSGNIYQCPLPKNDVNVKTQCTIIATVPIIENPGGGNIGQLQLGLDNKIYAAIPAYDKIGVIEFPEKEGRSCNFIQDAVDLAGRKCLFGLPAIYQTFVADEYTGEVCNCCMYIPNSFTPNNDKQNDVFLPSIDCGVNDYYVLIFNSWGEEIFESTEISNGWDGNFKSKQAPNGAYFYKMIYTYTDPDGNSKTEKKAGAIYLER